jgi:putative oxidoreductase
MTTPVNTAAAFGRVALALIFILSGVGKLAAPEATLGYINAAGLPFPELAFVGATALELVGGVALVLGLRTRVVAVVLAGFSLVAAIAFHAQFADQNQMVHFLKNVAIAGGLLQVAAFGSGAISFDRLLISRRASVSAP